MGGQHVFATDKRDQTRYQVEHCKAPTYSEAEALADATARYVRERTDPAVWEVSQGYGYNGEPEWDRKANMREPRNDSGEMLP